MAVVETYLYGTIFPHTIFMHTSQWCNRRARKAGGPGSRGSQTGEQEPASWRQKTSLQVGRESVTPLIHQ